jgi:hypothetical protein
MDTKYINNIVIDNIKSRYNTELEYVETEEERTEIKKLLQKYDKFSEKKINIFDKKMNEIDMLTMKKQFYRLKEPQKINRLVLFFTETYNMSEENSQKSTDIVINLLNEGTLKNKDIEYDIDNIKITNINNISVDKETQTISFFVQKKTVVKKEKQEEVSPVKKTKTPTKSTKIPTKIPTKTNTQKNKKIITKKESSFEAESSYSESESESSESNASSSEEDN